MVEPQEGATGKISSIAFNQDQGCFACSTGEGFRIYNAYPFKETFQRELGGGIGLVSMLYRSNILALVGGGERPKFPQNKVMIWDDHQMKGIGELSFKSNVRSVRLRKERIVVALEQRIYIYQISDLKLLDALDTFPNPEGLCALSPKDATILVCPDKKKGFIRITNYDSNTSVEKKAHDSSLSAIAISMDGKLCATASDKGTLIRVFATEDGKLLQELRRGADKADIHCIAFDKTSHWLACTSDKGTVHIFSLASACKVVYKSSDGPESPEAKHPPGAKPEAGAAKNPTSVFKFMKGIFSYFSSEWSFAQFRIPDAHSVVAFGPEDQNVIIGTSYPNCVVVSYDGKYYVAKFDPKAGGECSKVSERSLMKAD